MQIPLDIAEALARIGLGRYEQIVMTEVQKAVYGVEKAPARLGLKETGTRYGLDAGSAKQCMWSAIKSLSDARILVKQGEGYVINEDIGQWRHKRAKAGPVSAGADDGVSATTYRGKRHDLPKSVPALTDVSAGAYPPCTPYKEEIQEREKDHLPRGRVGRGMASHEADGIREWILGLLPNPMVVEGRLPLLLQSDYPADWVREAVQIAVASKGAASYALVQVALGCLRRWRAAERDDVAAGREPSRAPWIDYAPGEDGRPRRPAPEPTPPAPPAAEAQDDISDAARQTFDYARILAQRGGLAS